MRIKRFQGGGMATFTPIVPTIPNTAIRPETKSGNAEEGSLLDKDIYKKLIDAGGLINDVNYFVEQISELENGSNPYLSGGNRQSAISMIGQVNELIQARKYWEESLKNAKDSGGLGEVAVDSNGRVFMRDSDNNIQTLGAREYHSMKSKPALLTVSDLLKARQYDKNLVGDNSIFEVANESIGMDKITGRIKDMMSLLSEASYSSERHYSRERVMAELQQIAGKKPTEQVLNAARELTEILETPGDYFKVTKENKSKRDNINRALGYIWSSLDPSSQKKLNAVATINGNSPDKLIYDMLISYTEPTVKSEISPETGEGIYGTKAKEDRKPLTVFQLIQKDKLATKNSNFAFNDTQLGVLFKGMIGGVSPIITPNGEPVGMQTLYNVLNNSKIGYGLFLDQEKATIGNKQLNNSELSQVVYDGKDAAKVYMPVDNSGNPDYKSFQVFKEIYKEYEENKDSWSAEEATSFFKQNGFNIVIDESYNGERMEKVIRDNSKVKPFYLMYGYTNDATELTEDTMFATRLSKREQDDISPYLKQVWTVGSGKSAVNLTPDGWLGEDYYKVMVAIPYKEGYAAIVDAMSGQGPKEAAVTMEQVSANLKGSQEKPVRTTSSDVFKNK